MNVTAMRREPDWRDELGKSRSGLVEGNERNVMHALRYAPELRGLVQFNEFSRKVEFTREPVWGDARAGDEWTDSNDVAGAEWLQHQGIPASRKLIPDCVERVARETRVHPIRDQLNSYKWDGRLRIGYLLTRYFKCTDNPHYLETISPKILIGAVARVFDPGCKVDSSLVLSAPQGYNKSRSVVALAGDPRWVLDDLPDLHSKDARQALAGKWFIELSELAALRKTQNRANAAGKQLLAMAQELENMQPLVGKYGGSISEIRDWIIDMKITGRRLAEVRPPAFEVISGQEKTDSLIGTLKAIMAERSGLLTNWDDLGSLVLAHCPEEHGAQWQREGGNGISGLLRFDAGVKAALADAGLLHWHGELDALDRFVRPNWLTDIEAIREAVNTKPPGGRCYYCRIEEPASSVELKEAGAEENGHTIHNGRVIRKPRTAYVHHRCEPYWLTWQAMIDSAPPPKTQAPRIADRRELS